MAQRDSYRSNVTCGSKFRAVFELLEGFLKVRTSPRQLCSNLRMKVAGQHAKQGLPWPSIGLFSLFADEWPSSCFDVLRKGTPASFHLFPVGSYVVVHGAGSFLPTLFGLLKAIC